MLNKITFYLLGGLLALSILTTGHANASGSIFLEPSSLTAPVNSLVTINVKISTSIPFNAAQIDLKYDTGFLEYVSYSKTGGVLPTMFGFQNNNGTIQSTLFNGEGSVDVGENLQLIAFTFKTIKSSNGTIVSFQPTTTAINGDQASGSPSNQTTITISSTTNQTDSPNIKPIQNTENPKIILNTINGFAGNNIDVKVVTNKPTSATVYYGNKDVLGNTASSNEFKTEHIVNLGDIASTFDGSNDYYYKVEVVDESGNKTTSEVIKINIQPTNVKLTIKDENGQILPGAVVRINDKEFTADENGQIFIDGILPGIISIYLKQPNGEFKLIGDTKLQSESEQQLFEVTPTGITNDTPVDYSKYLPVILIAIIFLLALILGLRKLIRLRKKHKEERLHSANPWGNKINLNPNQATTQSTNNQQKSELNDINNVVNNSVNISKAMASNESANLNNAGTAQIITNQETSQNIAIANTNTDNLISNNAVLDQTKQPIANYNQTTENKPNIIVGDAVNDD